jgi:FkbM family methyltransferase
MSNLSKSPDLLKRIKVHNVAVSDSIGEIEFNFSGNIDDGSSSGSFITGSNTPESSLLYESIGFKKVNVQTVTLDELSSTMHIDDIPFLIKIDVEGAEHLVLEGGKKFIKQYKPIILLEIHSIFNMMKCYEFFSDLNYKLELLQQEPDGRCFIAATKD